MCFVRRFARLFRLAASLFLFGTAEARRLPASLGRADATLLEELLVRHAASACEQMRAVQDHVGDDLGRGWSYDGSGALTFGDKQTYRVQVLGVYEGTSFHWAWDAPPEMLAPPLRLAATALRQRGEREHWSLFTSRELHMSGRELEHLALVAAQLAGGKGYYIATSQRDDGATSTTVFLLDDERLPTAPPADAVRATGTLLLTFGAIHIVDPLRAAQLFAEANGMQVVRARDALLLRERDGSTSRMKIRRTATKTTLELEPMPNERARGEGP